LLFLDLSLVFFVVIFDSKYGHSVDNSELRRVININGGCPTVARWRRTNKIKTLKKKNNIDQL
jgi:hypothetical protein